MSRPLYRGFSGIGGNKDRCAAADEDRYDPKQEPSENGIASATPTASRGRRRHLAAAAARIALLVLAAAALLASVAWAGSLYAGRGTTAATAAASARRGYRRLQEQLVADLLDIGELAGAGGARAREAEACAPELDTHVPCYYNGSDALADVTDLGGGVVISYERQCAAAREGRVACLVPPPRAYRTPVRWPSCREFIWKDNVRISGHEFSSGSLFKRMMVEEDQISFPSDAHMSDGVEDYAHQIAEMIGLRNEFNFNEAGVRTVLDIECGFGTLGSHLFARNLLTMCIANYEASGSQVQITLERGIPALIGSFGTKQLPYPYLSFDMVHCAKCNVDWDKNDGVFLVEVDRLLRPGGYFVWTSNLNTHRALRDKENQKKWTTIRDLANNLCWEMLSQQDETIVWKKTNKKDCYSSRKSEPVLCAKSHDPESPYYQPLNPCIAGTRSRRWIPIEHRTTWPSQARLNSTELDIHGVHSEVFAEDTSNWDSMVRNYWSLLSPLIFSDHPKRPGDEDPQPPFNMLRNVLDMNAHFGGFNAALLKSGKSVWVMNVVPTNAPDNLPLIFDRGFIGVQHDWCEAFPTYPRTYDMVHADGLLSLEKRQKHRCSTLDIFLEVDRILRPEGWIMIRDTAPLIEAARSVAAQLRWDARILDLDIASDEKLLVCQKPFLRKQ
ncbi:probable pectin methyltransferase QUA2 [Lolium rigidum]|uniref:probable pectin methyltransferase QUA2 n=1 Tax=Lolium rigidum TaxID=89674 RepID=UPI001F5C162C|nr:probable pectin methyltransferase QUA2 [Lolium rigidum]